VATKGRAKGNTLVNKQTNSFLDQMEYTLHDLTLQIQREGKQVSAKEILDRYKYCLYKCCLCQSKKVTIPLSERQSPQPVKRRQPENGLENQNGKRLIIN
jgi:hypothetical protein